jgi:predicted ATPase
MIVKWTLRNFKSIERTQSLDLSPLTLLCGPNSSGKSTVLQSMLILSQSATARLQPQPLQLNGRFVQLGTLQEVLHQGGGSTFTVGCELNLGNRPDAPERALRLRTLREMRASIECEVGSGPTENLASAARTQLERLLLRGAAAGIGEAKLLVTRRHGGRPPRGAVTAEVMGATISNERYRIELDDVTEEGPDRVLQPQTSRSAAGVELQGPLPTGLWRSFNPRARQMTRRLRELLILDLSTRPRSSEDFVLGFFGAARDAGLIDSAPSNWAAIGDFIQSLPENEHRLLRTYVTDYVSNITGTDTERSFERVPLSPLLGEASSAIVHALTQMRHIGPLREAPQALYALPSSADPLEVGSRGEFTAAVLHRFRRRPIRYLWQSEEIQEPLGAAVDRWLGFLGVHQGALTEDFGRLGHVLSVRDQDVRRPLDLTQVGVGVSQLLPIVVQGLLTPAGGTVLLEQPELHLHPAVQARLADFLWSLASSNRLIVCETHSEYLVNRLRIRMASGALKDTDVAVYFAEREAGNTRFERIRFDSRGRIGNWPTGFFDQSASDAAALLDLQMNR